MVGPEHVGLGSDFDGIPAGPQGLEGPHRFPDLARALTERGYKDQVRAIMGLNFASSSINLGIKTQNQPVSCWRVI